uniref:Uncharacterized protein n=1 Tax=Acinetobacter phage vB_AbaM-SPB TaxID=3236747 RepID=A0AB39C8X0_9CAUD
MTKQEVVDNAPEGATHYGIEHDECGRSQVVYLTANCGDFALVASSGLSVDEYKHICSKSNRFNAVFLFVVLFWEANLFILGLFKYG